MDVNQNAEGRKEAGDLYARLHGSAALGLRPIDLSRFCLVIFLLVAGFWLLVSSVARFLR